MWRIPDKGAVTPRLQEPPAISAIGFLHDFSERNESED